MKRYTHATRRVAGLDPDDHPSPEEIAALEREFLQPTRPACPERDRYAVLNIPPDPAEEW